MCVPSVSINCPDGHVELEVRRGRNGTFTALTLTSASTADNTIVELYQQS